MNVVQVLSPCGVSVECTDASPERGSCRKSLEEWSKKIIEKIRIQSTVGNVSFSIWSPNDRRCLLSCAS